jgi:hypothetical protein
LPPAETRRWSSRRKAAIVIAIRAGVLNRQGAYELYTLSLEELALSKSSPLGRPRSIKTASRACASRAYRFTSTVPSENAKGHFPGSGGNIREKIASGQRSRSKKRSISDT